MQVLRCLADKSVSSAGLSECRKIADSFDEGKHIIMFNPRLMRWD